MAALTYKQNLLIYLYNYHSWCEQAFMFRRVKGILFEFFIIFQCLVCFCVPVVVGHGSSLQRRPRVFVHANAAPLIFAVITCVGDVQHIVTANPETRRVAVGTEVKVHTHIERVGAGEGWRREFSH